MIVTFDDGDEAGLEPLMVFCVHRGEKTFSVKFMDGLTREQIEAMARSLPALMERAIAIHQRLM